MPIDPVGAYARAVLAGKVVAARLVRLACQRHLDDLRTAKARHLHWDAKAVARTIDFFPTFLRLVARSRELELAIRDAKNHLASLEADLLKIDVIADQAGLSGQLAKALAPPPPAPVVQYTRVKVIKPFKTLWRGPHGAEQYSAAPGSIVDLPSELIPKLRSRVEPAKKGAEIFGVPLQPGMITDDD